MEKTQTYPNNTNTKLSLRQNGIIEKIRDSQSLPPKEWSILDDQILEVLRQKFEIKKFLGLNQWASGSLPLSIRNVPQQYSGGNQISGESLLYRLCISI